MGEYLHSLEGEEPLRKRWTSRAMYAHELNLLLNKQSEYHTWIKESREDIENAILGQKPIQAPKAIKKCFLEPKKGCLKKWHPLAQEFLVLQDLNHLKIRSWRTGEQRELSEEERETLKIITHLALLPPNAPKIIQKAYQKKGELTFSDLRKVLNLEEDDTFNLEGAKTKVTRHETNRILKEIFGEEKFSSLINPGELVAIWENESDNETIQKILSKKGFSEEDACRFATARFPEGRIAHSQKAVTRLLEHMRSGDAYSSAKMKAYPEGGTVSLETTNPTVTRTFHEAKRTLRALEKEYGRPDLIRIELATDREWAELKKDDYTQEIRKRQKEREKAIEFVTETWPEHFGSRQPRKDDITKYLLWKEINELFNQIPPLEPNGKPISASELFDGDIEIEHIIPLSLSHDDSFANKTLCRRKTNAEKANRILSEWLDAQKFNNLLEAIRPAQKKAQGKCKRLGLVLNKEGQEYIQTLDTRSLQDTRYICRHFKEWLEQQGYKVETTNGSTTARLRRAWGLPKKDREDNRHHAMDALVVALTSTSIAKKIREETVTACTLPNIREAWAKEAETIVVSKREDRKPTGELHEASIYGKIQTRTGEEFVIRVAINSLSKTDFLKGKSTIESCVDQKIREVLKKFFSNPDIGLEKIKTGEFPMLPHKKGGATPIKKFRAFAKCSEEAMRKINRGFIKTGSNFEMHIDHKGKSTIITTFAAGKNKTEWREGWTLRKGTAVEIDQPEGRKIAYVAGIAQSGEIKLRLHNTSSADITKTIRKKGKGFISLNPKIVKVSQLGNHK